MVPVDLYGDSAPIAPRPRSALFPAFPIAVISLVCLGAALYLATGGWNMLSSGLSRLGRPLTQADSEARCMQLTLAPDGSSAGTCRRWSPRFGTQTTFEVVNSGQPLRMPEYTVVEGSTQFVPTMVRNRDPREYPDEPGQLMSIQLRVTNTTRRWLDFGQGAGGGSGPHFATIPETVELRLPNRLSRSGETGYDVLLEGRGAPQPDLFGRIGPHSTRTGWVTFVVPTQALASSSLPGARLDFLRIGERPGFTGQVRI